MEKSEVVYIEIFKTSKVKSYTGDFKIIRIHLIQIKYFIESVSCDMHRYDCYINAT